MIEIVKTLDVDTLSKLQAWLEGIIRPNLKLDVSNYAKGRKTLWLRYEPQLNSSQVHQGFPVSDGIWNRLQELIEWRFDYCLITNSGSESTGIAPHRDASYASYEAYGLNVNGECEFYYWESRKSFGYSKASITLDAKVDRPTHKLVLKPGDVVHFNSKNEHSAIPSPNRWNVNFWRKK